MSRFPLAAVLRPKTLNDIIGQDHLISDGKPLRKMMESKKFQSIIFWGPTGTGKTSIAKCLALESGSIFRQLNATNASVKELRLIIDQAIKEPDRDTFVFVDEIHRWNKAQQDVMLPVVENGDITLFGATTERPKFAVNSTLLSRCLVLEVKPLENEHMIELLKKALAYYKGKGKNVTFDKKSIKTLINRCSGDARKFLMVIETIVEILSDDGFISEELVNQAIPDKHLVFDAHGNDHFDLAHCYQESIQNSDVNSAIYWLAKWLSSGEDPAYISRRMLITAFEDCAGNPFAATTAMAAAFAVERTGMPECMIPMALATCEMAMSERNKSAYYAIKAAMADVENGATVHVPPALRAGTVGYVKMINKVYLKGWAKDWEAIDKSVKDSLQDSHVMYAIGIRGTDSFTHGPSPKLKAMLDINGDENSCIMQLQGDNVIPLYLWDSVAKKFRAIDQ